ncbi:MAG: four helix bundle protein [Muribaculaceae bacterium]|nr:four helix bundle protein [Muribaculaceae bacterium]
MARKQGFTDLQVWRKAVKILNPVYNVIKTFPSEERHALGEQLRRSSVSISSNIAEGQARGTNKAFINHLNIAKGSSAEVQSQLYVAVELGYTTLEIIDPIEEELVGIDMMLTKLINSIDRKDGF